MTIKSYGYSSSGQHLTGGLDYFTLTTAVDIRPTGVYAPAGYFLNLTTPTSSFPITPPPYVVNGVSYADLTAYNAARASQIAFDKLIEVISTRGQAVIMGIPSGSGPFVFRWASEHRDAWYNISQGVSLTPATVPPLGAGGVYTPAIPAVGPYDAVPDMVTTIVNALGAGFTLYPGTPDAQLVSWSTAFTTGNTSVTVTNSL